MKQKMIDAINTDLSDSVSNYIWLRWADAASPETREKQKKKKKKSTCWYLAVHFSCVLAESRGAADVWLPFTDPHRDLIVAIEVMRKMELFLPQTRIKTVSGQER